MKLLLSIPSFSSQHYFHPSFLLPVSPKRIASTTLLRSSHACNSHAGYQIKSDFFFFNLRRFRSSHLPCPIIFPYPMRGQCVFSSRGDVLCTVHVYIYVCVCVCVCQSYVACEVSACVSDDREGIHIILTNVTLSQHYDSGICWDNYQHNCVCIYALWHRSNGTRCHHLMSAETTL